MKLLVAIIGAEKLEAVQEALKVTSMQLVSVASVESRAEGRPGMYRGLAVRFQRRKVRVEIATEDGLAAAGLAEIAKVVIPADASGDCDDVVFTVPMEASARTSNAPRATARGTSRALIARGISGSSACAT